MSVTAVRNFHCLRKQCYAMKMKNTLLKEVINTTFIKVQILVNYYVFISIINSIHFVKIHLDTHSF